MKRLLLIPVAVSLLLACDQDVPSESADLRRPAGLAYVPRADGMRSDILVVDSEAQGVRVRQILTLEDGARQSGFIPSPVVFFPLVIPAPGFPTRVAVDEDGTRGYVIAPVELGQMLENARSATSFLHVIDVADQGFGTRVTENDHIRLGSVDLGTVVSGAFLPVDVVWLEQDRVLVAFDEVGSGASVLAALTLPALAEPATELVTPSATETASIAGGVRAIVVKDGVAYATSAGATITAVELSGGSFGTVRTLDAGGPTHELVDAGEELLAFRSDRPSIVVFTATTGGVLARSAADYDTAYTAPTDRSDATNRPADARGRLDLRDSPLGPGAYLASAGPLGFDESENDVTADGDPLALVTHFDGVITYLTRTDGQLGLGVVETGSVATVWRRDDDTVGIEECPGLQTGQGDAPLDTAVCEGGGLDRYALPTAVRYRATYRGAMSRATNGIIKASSSTIAGVVTLRDGAIEDFTTRLVAAGDLVDVAFIAPETCEDGVATETRVERQAEVSVLAVSGSELQLVMSATIAQSRCADGDEWPIVLYEVYPGNDDAVLVSLDNGAIDQVLDRAPATNGGTRAALGAIPQGGTFSPVRVTLVQDSGFYCQPRTGEVGEVCFSDLECAEGWACTAPAGASAQNLPRCETVPCLAAECLTTPIARGCSGVEIAVGATQAAEVDVKGDTADPNSSVASSAPDDAIALDREKSFLVSFPGGRSVVEVRPGNTRTVVDQVR